MKALDRSEWVKRKSASYRRYEDHLRPFFEAYYYGEKVAEGTGSEICRKLNLSHGKFASFSNEYDVFDITRPGYYENHDKNELVRMIYRGMKDYSGRWKKRTDSTIRRNNHLKIHLYGLYDDQDELIFMGTISELSEYIGCNKNAMQKRAAKYDEWDAMFKDERHHIVYLGEEEQECY